MKKISLFLVTAIFMIAFTACTGAKKTDAPTDQPVKSDSIAQVVAVDTTAVVPAAPALTPAEMLKNFQEYAKAYGDAFNNLVKDPNKFSELSKQSKAKVDEMEKIKGGLNPTQLKTYQKALEIVLKVNRGGK